MGQSSFKRKGSQQTKAIVANDSQNSELDQVLSRDDNSKNTILIEDNATATESTAIESSSISSTDDDDDDKNTNEKKRNKKLKSILSASKKNKSARPRVQFGNLEMRFYDRTLGDNPACVNGAPVELDWTYNDKTFNTPIEEFEGNRLPRRTRRQLVMTSVTRRNMMVYHFGCTHDQIDKAANSTKKIQRQRERTKSLSPAVEKRQEMTENFTKIFRWPGSNSSRDDLMSYEQKRSVDAYENDHFNTLLMVR